MHQLSKLPEEEYDRFLEWLYDYEYSKLSLPEPDMVIYLSLPPELSVKLLEKRCSDTGNGKDIHESDITYISNCYKAARYSARKLGWQTVNVNDGDTIRSEGDVHGEILNLLFSEQ